MTTNHFVEQETGIEMKKHVLPGAKLQQSMTEGPIWKGLIYFAIPIFFGNLFQQLYNTADTLIVGNFLGKEALAAVASSGNLIFMMVGFLHGMAMGAGVVGENLALEIVDIWVGTEFSGEERHQRRIDKLMALEK